MGVKHLRLTANDRQRLSTLQLAQQLGRGLASACWVAGLYSPVPRLTLKPSQYLKPKESLLWPCRIHFLREGMLRKGLLSGSVMAYCWITLYRSAVQ